MRDITPAMAAEFSSGSVQPALLAELFFDSVTSRMWTGFGTLNWDGNEFLGGGNFIGISNIEETQELEAKGLVVSLNGIPSNLIATALLENVRGRAFRLYLATVITREKVLLEDGDDVLTEDGGNILLESVFLDSPYRLFSGLMDVIEISDNGQTADMRLSVENILITGRRTKIRRYTNEDQRKFYPTDEGLGKINALQDTSLVW